MLQLDFCVNRMPSKHFISFFSMGIAGWIWRHVCQLIFLNWRISCEEVLMTSFTALLLTLDLILGFMTNGFGGLPGPLHLRAIYAGHFSSIMDPFITQRSFLLSIFSPFFFSSYIIFADLHWRECERPKNQIQGLKGSFIQKHKYPHHLVTGQHGGGVLRPGFTYEGSRLISNICKYLTLSC